MIDKYMIVVNAENFQNISEFEFDNEPSIKTLELTESQFTMRGILILINVLVSWRNSLGQDIPRQYFSFQIIYSKT